MIQAVATGIRPAGVQLVVENMERSARFYRGVLGMEVAHRANGLAVLSGEDGAPALALREIAGGAPRAAHRPGVTLRFEMASLDVLDEVSARLVRAGSRISPVRQGSRRSVFATDPDGYAFEAYHDEAGGTY